MKDITIQENLVDQNYDGTEKITTPQVPNGSVSWIPADGTSNTVDLTVTQNGTYTAESDGYYGYASVTVNVTDSDNITGIDRETGTTYRISVDDEGNIVKEAV